MSKDNGLKSFLFKGVEDFNYSRCPDKKYKREWITKYLTCYLEREPTKDEIDNLLDGNDVFEAVNYEFILLYKFFPINENKRDFCGFNNFTKCFRLLTSFGLFGLWYNLKSQPLILTT